MLSDFGASLSFEEKEICSAPVLVEDQKKVKEAVTYDDWLLQRRVKMPRQDDWDGGELGDSSCFGTRTVESSVGMDCVWKLHGGI
jgi:hypothetical protein